MSVAFVLKGYPRLSETFIAQEILGLEKRGLDIRIISLRHPTDKAAHTIVSEIQAPVSYLPEYLHNEPARVLKSLVKAKKLSGFSNAWHAFQRDFARDRTRNRIRRFGQACVLAAELPDDVTRLHFHFLHTPASVTRYAAIMRGLPWSGSAHAKDIWTSPDWDLREKLAEMDWLATCTAYGAEHLRALSNDPKKVDLTYHGLDFSRFSDVKKSYSKADGSDPNHPVLLLSVGRAVAKKGYDDLLEALALIPTGLYWRFIHIGGGTLSGTLKEKARKLGIASKIEWRGAQPQDVVLESLRDTDLFVLASKISEDGDRDGLPNVLMEAQSQGLPVLSTAVSAIPELILPEETGILVPPADSAKLSEQLERLIRDPKLRKTLGKNGKTRVRSEFDAHHCLGDLVRRFGLSDHQDQGANTDADGDTGNNAA
ncbi:glycosyltransferase family 4 protein [Aestuariispira insulae]|uniref:Glycosyltransferase involved in cell wall biosynthesis n=1 Tax=Aestuariispira insulae TaxID=1461337 RepID=A0A3D9HPE0_9PROT|nr:glycosyltransferase family 4 protein [Aestuariispira insulae]RED51329.1 glycosyltransferase involved in cell wall biosynthesis [Aestuariispira insulae]